MSEAIAMCFSGGKDSALALQDIRQQSGHQVVELLTTVTDAYERVSMHGVRRTLLREQAAAVGIPLTEVVVPPQSSNAIYEREMGKAFARVRADGIRRVAFGDIFLEELRAYREHQLAEWDLEGLFPLWKQDTATLARAFIGDGFQAMAVCVNPARLDASFAGRAFDDTFLADLPPDVDPCGENGEFHTFVSDGPIFSRPIAVSRGAVVERSGFVYCDVLHEDGEAATRPGTAAP
ncbi:MAG: adenine nucleotide alpha hydrolase [Vicinamibacterales bacterium]|jgi:uncharacterized protein (TIGR00290 family)|nr:adenine nucleotide alpha hydrolase [Vicinamibacterales bacterium]